MAPIPRRQNYQLGRITFNINQNKKMKLEIKSLKSMQGHDCLAFSLNLYIDGKRSMTVRNDGNGGGHCYESLKWEDAFPQADFDRLKKMADALPMEVTDMKNDDGTFFEYQPDVDSIIDELIDRSMASKQLKKLMRTKTLAVEGEDVISWSGPPSGKFSYKGEEKELREIVGSRHPKATILNDLPFDEAFELWK